MVKGNLCQHNIGIEFTWNEQDGKIYVVSGCIILATIVPCGKGKEDSYKVEYKSLEVDRTIGKSNHAENIYFN